jgi:hypothetical protein
MVIDLGLTVRNIVITYVKSGYFLSLIPYRSRDSSVGIATGYGLDDGGLGVRFPIGSRIFTSGPVLMPTLPPMGTGSSFVEDKAAGT